MPGDVVERVNDIQLAREFKWSLEYIRELSLEDYLALLGALDGEEKYHKLKHKK
mgnify:CR=1 FL=1